MDKNKNLIPFNTMDPEHHKELSRRGGVASGATRRRKAAIRASLVDALEKSYIVDEVMDEYDKALTIVRQKEKRRRQDAKRKRASRERSKAEPRTNKGNNEHG